MKVHVLLALQAGYTNSEVCRMFDEKPSLISFYKNKLADGEKQFVLAAKEFERVNGFGYRREKEKRGILHGVADSS